MAKPFLCKESNNQDEENNIEKIPQVSELVMIRADSSNKTHGMRQRQNFDNRLKIRGKVACWKYDARKEEHGRDESGEKKVELVDGADKRCNEKGYDRKHRTGQKSNKRGQETLRRTDDAENHQNAQYDKRKKQSLGARPKNLTRNDIPDGQGCGQHSIIDFIKFQADKCAVAAFKRCRKHGRGHQKPSSQKFQITEPFHGLRNIRAQTKSNSGQKQQRFKKCGQSIAEDVFRVDAHMPLPDPKKPPGKRRKKFLLTVFH